MLLRKTLLWVICCGVPLAGIAASREFPRNPGIIRVSEGQYENRDASSGALLGTESFRLTVHADGSRCLMIWSNSASRATQITSKVCADAQFRPTEAYARYWIGGSFRGSGWIRVDGPTLTLTSANAQGALTTTTTNVPKRFSIGTHPISADAWHVAVLGDSDSDLARSFTLNPAGPGTEALTGALVDIPIQRLERETVQVPAGRFLTRKLQLSGQATYWATEQDWLVFKSSTPSSVRKLVEFREHN